MPQQDDTDQQRLYEVHVLDEDFDDRPYPPPWLGWGLIVIIAGLGSGLLLLIASISGVM